VQEEELKGAVVLIFANKQVKTIFSSIHIKFVSSYSYIGVDN
jgi:hypothetical protein